MQCSHSIGNRWQGTKERSCESAPACFSKNNKLGGWVICPRYEVAWSKVLSAQFNGHSFALSRTKHTNTISLQNTVCHFEDSINFQHGVSEFAFWATGLRSAVSLSDPKGATAWQLEASHHHTGCCAVESVYCRNTRRNKRRKTKQARKPYDIKVCNVKSGKLVSGVRSSNLPIVDVRGQRLP